MSFWRDLRLGVHLEDSTCPENLVRPCLGPHGWVVGKSSVSSRVWKFDGTWRILTENAVGSWSGAIDYLGRALWQENGIGLVRELGSGYEVVGGYSSAGILDVRPDNSVVFDDGAQTPFRRSDGSQILIPKACIRTGIVLGYANDVPGGSGVVAGELATGRLWRVWSGDPQSLPLRLDDDGLTAAISGPQGGFIQRSAWTEEPFQPPVVLPDIQPFTSPKIVAVYPQTNSTLTHSAGMNARIVFGGPGVLVEAPEGHFIRDWVDTEVGQAIPEGEAVVYCDISRVAEIAGLLKPWQVIAFNCYPNPGETKAAFKARIQVAIDHVTYDYILVAGAWNRGTLTDQEVLDGMAVVRELAE